MPKRHPFSNICKTRISASLKQALEERCLRTGESVDHIIQTALAEELDVEHHTIFQISTSTALVEGVYQGCVSIAEIKQHGNFGLGTFDSLDGEGIMLQGEVWQAKGDGSLAKVADSTLAPFWVMTNFKPDRCESLNKVSCWENLCAQIDRHRNSENLFFSIHLSGVFHSIDYRVACKTSPGTDLVTATEQQALFHLEDCAGDLIGFWSPHYAKTLNVPGYHLHFLSKDKQHAGHVLDLKADKLDLELSEQNHLKVALPESNAFLQADLSADPAAALAKAEMGKQAQ
ncbi:acetolactate decarboxylase [Legionella sp. km772]|nr:acetolactate decarboxylase [Legionella sp. km772]